jgi:hypothetical protein
MNEGRKRQREGRRERNKEKLMMREGERKFSCEIFKDSADNYPVEDCSVYKRVIASSLSCA